MAMSMDCMVPAQNKRRHEEDLDVNVNQTKRFCSGSGSCNQFENGAVSTQLTESPMDTWDMHQQQSLPRSRNPNCTAFLCITSTQTSDMRYASEDGGFVQLCLRCKAGESGHINHIMGF
ncbi:uncharacterized protein C10orf143 homolog [Lepisosteus oculatus]|uniref:uncharacterized protein C10orf143 homolog n=1 Tax=Lepisosteus oculatus TaxID=7918 RepID=UPI00372193F5